MLDQIAEELKAKVQESIDREEAWDREFKVAKDKKELQKLKKIPLRTVQIHGNYEFDSHNKYE